MQTTPLGWAQAHVLCCCLLSAACRLKKLFRIHFNDFPSHVVPTFGTHDVRGHGGATFGTVRPLDRCFVIVGTASACSGVAVFSFGDCHKKSENFCFKLLKLRHCTENSVLVKGNSP